MPWWAVCGTHWMPPRVDSTSIWGLRVGARSSYAPVPPGLMRDVQALCKHAGRVPARQGPWDWKVLLVWVFTPAPRGVGCRNAWGDVSRPLSGSACASSTSCCCWMTTRLSRPRPRESATGNAPSPWVGWWRRLSPRRLAWDAGRRSSRSWGMTTRGASWRAGCGGPVWGRSVCCGVRPARRRSRWCSLAPALASGASSSPIAGRSRVGRRDSISHPFARARCSLSTATIPRKPCGQSARLVERERS